MMLPRQASRSRFAPVSAVLLLLFLVYYWQGHHGRQLLSSTGLGYQYVQTSFDWRNFQQKYPVPHSDIIPLPKGEPRQFSPVQHDFPDDASGGEELIQVERRDAVRRAFLKSWESYKKYAWGADELMPVTAGRKNTFGGYAATLVDSLDTLWIMGLETEFKEAVAVVARLDWMNTTETSLNLFETTIRHLSGLLSAFDLSQEQILLTKAIELGDLLLVAFDTPNRMPGFWLSFEDAKLGLQVAGTNDPSASPCTLSLEFTRLAQLTGEDKYYDAVHRVTQFLARTQLDSSLPGMWPTQINFRDEVLSSNTFSLGALGDSLYEYLVKMSALTGGLEPLYERLYREAVATAQKHLLFRPMITGSDNILFAGTAIIDNGVPRLEPESEHLACFAGGMFGLGGKLFDSKTHVNIGEQLARGCAWAYAAFPTGLMPEIFSLVPCPSLDKCPWDEERWQAEGDESLPKGFTHARDARYMLRPEAVESLFLMWRMTGKPEYRNAGWAMFQAIRDATETTYGYSAIADVRVSGPTEKMDSMESFWLAETLKYLYLMFSSPNHISLDEYVFNTEAHPLRRPLPKKRQRPSQRPSWEETRHLT